MQDYSIKDLIGLDSTQAAQLVLSWDCLYRIVSVDGAQRSVKQDAVPNRINVELENNKVKLVKVG